MKIENYTHLYVTLSGEMAVLPVNTQPSRNLSSRKEDTSLEAASGVAPKRGMVLPFTPLAMSFDNVNYFVDMPPVRIEILI